MKKMFLAVVGIAMLMSGAAYAGSGGAHWGYTGDEGPSHWGDLAPEYKMCKEGKNQSPVNIVTEDTSCVDAVLEELKLSYKPSALDVVNNGHTIKVNYAKGSTMEMGGTTFNLLQYHFHSPSENNIDSKSYPMEVHLVHADADGNLAVIGTMYVEGKANAAIDAVWAKMPAKAGEKVSASDVSVNVMDILPANKEYYRFDGSLTTPPCSEGVRWMVMKNPVEVSKEQVKKFHSTMHGDTNRPVQPLNARVIIQ